MASFNKVILLGNLTRDPQLRYLPSQMPVVDFGLAVNHRYRTKDGQDKEEVLFIDCSCFGKSAETINQYCRKGKALLVEGRLRYETWEDKQGGGKRSKHSIMVEGFQFVGGRDGGQAGDAGGDTGDMSQRPARPASRPPQRQANAAPPPEQPYGEEQQFKEDDIPF